MERFAAALQQLPREQGQVMAALHLAQEELGWVPRDAIRLIAKHLRVSDAQVYGPASFYAEFRFTPPPKTLVSWCSGPTCRVVGGDRLRRIFESVLECRLGENGPKSDDGESADDYGLWLGQCNGTCERAPMVWVNGRVVGPLSMSEAVSLARRIKDGEQVVDFPQQPVKIAPAVFQDAEAVYGAEQAPASGAIAAPPTGAEA